MLQDINPKPTTWCWSLVIFIY